MLWLINLADLFENLSTFVCFIMPFIVHLLFSIKLDFEVCHPYIVKLTSWCNWIYFINEIKSYCVIYS